MPCLAQIVTYTLSILQSCQIARLRHIIWNCGLDYLLIFWLGASDRWLQVEKPVVLLNHSPILGHHLLRRLRIQNFLWFDYDLFWTHVFRFLWSFEFRVVFIAEGWLIETFRRFGLLGLGFGDRSFLKLRLRFVVCILLDLVFPIDGIIRLVDSETGKSRVKSFWPRTNQVR